MTAQELADIAAACDRLLEAADTSLERIAVPLLHVIGEHPSTVRRYAPLQHPGTAAPGRQRPLGRVHVTLRIARALIASALLPRDRAYAHALRALGPVDVLLISHLGSPALLGGDDDFYLGAMQRLLHGRGRTSLLLLVNHASHDESSLRERARRPLPCARLVLPRGVPLLDEARLWIGCARADRALRRTARGPDSALDRGVAALAARDAVGHGTVANLRLHHGVAQACRLLRPSVVLTTCEGDASERMIWHAARTAAPGVLCAGYQHTRLLAHAHAIRRSLAAPPGLAANPDVLLTLGDVTHAMLAASPRLGPVRLRVYGSHRRAATAPGTDRRDRSHRCVVLPDGDDSECATLFGFAVACARLLPEMSFALRPHPIVGFDALGARHPALRTLPANVEASPAAALGDDLARARYCLYRGSSSVIHAVLAGVKPFYLARPGEMPFDPLFALEEWRETVATPEEFVGCVEADRALAPLDPLGSAWQYCDRYASRVRPEALDELLAAHAG